MKSLVEIINESLILESNNPALKLTDKDFKSLRDRVLDDYREYKPVVMRDGDKIKRGTESPFDSDLRKFNEQDILDIFDIVYNPEILKDALYKNDPTRMNWNWDSFTLKKYDDDKIFRNFKYYDDNATKRVLDKVFPEIMSKLNKKKKDFKDIQWIVSHILDALNRVLVRDQELI